MFDRPHETRLKASIGKRREKPFAPGGSKSAAGVGFIEQAKEGRRQLDAQRSAFDSLRGRAQTLITVTLVVLAQAFCTLLRLDPQLGPKAAAPA